MMPNPVKWLATRDIDWRAARFIAIGYLALTAFVCVLALPIASASLGLSWVLVFLSGPAGMPLALVTTPARFAMTVLSLYIVGICALAPFLTLSCHRNARISVPSRVVAVLLWLVAGFFSVAYVFAFAA